MALYDRLTAKESESGPIRIGAVGAGWMGGGFLAAVRHVPGMRIACLADDDPGLAERAATECGGVHPDEIVRTDSRTQAEDAVRAGKLVVTGDVDLPPTLQGIDIATDVTPSPASGARAALRAIEAGNDVVLVNIEADVTVGRELKRRAAAAGVLYSVSSGDEPGCLMELWDFVRTLGYLPIVIGKGKNNPLNPDATPDTVRASAEKADKDPFQVASYVDGTKTMFELTCVANATGCVPSQPGMTGPEADLQTVSDAFRLTADGGTVPHPGVVDYVQGQAMAGGVFVTVKIDDERIGADLAYLKVGKGPYFTFFRPYHLWFLEAPISIARAFFDREVTLASLDRPVADVATVAKRDLQPGEVLDTFGGYTFRGVNYPAAEFRTLGALPVGLAPGAKMRNPVRKGAVIGMQDVSLDDTLDVVRLRRSQDQAT